MVHMPSQNAGIWGRGVLAATRKINSGRRLAIQLTHANEASAQVGSIVNCMFNRDCMTHTHINFIGPGLPLKTATRWRKSFLALEDAYDETKTTRQSMTQKLNMLSVVAAAGLFA